VIHGDSAYRRTTTGEDAIDAAVATAVATLARRVEQHLGGAQDLEWALADGELVLLQARPVTTLPQQQVRPVPVAADPPPGYWTREASHAPAPVTPFTRVVASWRTPIYRNMCAQLGLLFDTIDFRDIGGWQYIRVVPLDANDRPGRIGTCVAAMRADICGRTVGRWYEEWQGEFARRIANMRDVDLA
jgi:hypothetical protein